MPEQTQPARAAALDDLFARWCTPETPGAALAVMQHGQVVHQNGYGSANLEYGVPITPHTVFHTASLAKQVTALAILLLADRGLLSLDDEVHEHLPDLPDFGHRIAVRHLLQHTSGLRDVWELLSLAGWRMDDVITRQDLLRLVGRQRELDFVPGTAFSYGNTSYSLLAEIGGRVSGQSLREYAREQIFAPLGMEQTHFRDDHEAVVPNRACSYTPAPDGSGFRNSVLSLATAGATSLLTTAADLGKWLANFERPVAGHAELLRQMQEPAVLSGGETVPYGLGVGLGTYRGFRVVQHIGIDAGYRSFLCWFPDLHVGVAVLANLSTMDVRSLAMQAAERFLDGQVAWEGEPPAPAAPSATQPERVRLSDEQLEAYVGSYYSDELDTTYRIAAEDGGLVVRHLMRADLRLEATAPDTFVQAPSGPLRLRFVRLGARVTGFRLDGNRVRNLWFAK